jgi:hypothetical protein
MNELINAVRSYATDNYNRDGWDVLVECWSDEDIARNIGSAKTAKGAIDKCRRITKAIASVRSDIQGA